MRQYSHPRGGGRPFDHRRGGRGRGRGTWQNRGPRPEMDPDHGDMKTGLFKASFLEDPWEHLLSGKKKTEPEGSQLGDLGKHEVDDNGNEVEEEDQEGEIELPDDDEDEEHGVEKA